MKQWLRKLRGLLGLGAVGGLGGAALGLAWGLVELLGAPGLVHLSLPLYVGAWSALGATVSVGFGLLLSATAGGRRVEELSPWHARLLGGVVGAAAPVVLLALFSGGLPGATATLLAGAICGTIGVGAASGLLEIAQRAAGPDALPDVDDRRMLE